MESEQNYRFLNPNNSYVGYSSSSPSSINYSSDASTSSASATTSPPPYPTYASYYYQYYYQQQQQQQQQTTYNYMHYPLSSSSSSSSSLPTYNYLYQSTPYPVYSSAPTTVIAASTASTSTSLDSSGDNVGDNSGNQQQCALPAARNIIDDLDEDKDQEEIGDIEPGEVVVKPSTTRRRVRTQFTLEQRRYLLSVFQTNSYPPKELLEHIAQSMSVTVTVLQTWFKNTRSKQKKLTSRKNIK